MNRTRLSRLVTCATISVYVAQIEVRRIIVVHGDPATSTAATANRATGRSLSPVRRDGAPTRQRACRHIDAPTRTAAAGSMIACRALLSVSRHVPIHRQRPANREPNRTTTRAALHIRPSSAAATQIHWCCDRSVRHAAGDRAAGTPPQTAVTGATGRSKVHTVKRSSSTRTSRRAMPHPVRRDRPARINSQIARHRQIETAHSRRVSQLPTGRYLPASDRR